MKFLKSCKVIAVFAIIHNNGNTNRQAKKTQMEEEGSLDHFHGKIKTYGK